MTRKVAGALLQYGVWRGEVDGCIYVVERVGGERGCGRIVCGPKNCYCVMAFARYLRDEGSRFACSQQK